MKQNLKIFLIFLGLLSLGILSEPSMENDSKEGLSDNEEKEIYIEEITEKYEKIEGFLTIFRDEETNKIFMQVSEDELGKEFIYFAHVLNGLTTTGKFTGGYADNGIFKIEKDFENLRFVRVLTNYSFDEDSPLINSKGSNISDSTFHVASIMAKNEDKDKEVTTLGFTPDHITSHHKVTRTAAIAGLLAPPGDPPRRNPSSQMPH